MYQPLEGMRTLSPGESHEWSLSVDNESLGSDAESIYPSSNRDVDVTGLGSGRYAFSVAGEWRVDSEWRPVGVVATFDAGGATVDVEPAPDLTKEEDGSVLSVTDSEEFVGREYEIRAAVADDGGVPLVPEWALRLEGVRNTVPFLGGEFDEVEYRTDDAVAFAPEETGRSYEYGETAVEFEVLQP